MNDVVIDVVHAGNRGNGSAGLFASFNDFGFEFPAVSAAPCAGWVKSDRVHVSTYFDVDTIFGAWLSGLNVGRPDAYCQLAGIHTTIENLPEGYQTRLGERGSGLSGGQRQRLAIARALLKRPQVLIFDEAVASLDDDSAEQVASAVNSLRGHVTVLFITHKIPPSLKVNAHLKLGAKPEVEAS